MKIEKTALLALGAAMTSGAALASNTVDKSKCLADSCR